ncbi:MAG: hypothetical protein RSC68_15045 [Acinetobacter sp.]
MKKQTTKKKWTAPVRWICTQCHRQYCGVKPCPFCHSAINSIPATNRQAGIGS